MEGNPINHSDPTGLEPLRLGYVEGMSTSAGLGYGDIDGTEIVYDYATMTRARFNYTGKVGGLFASIGVAAYVGGVTGFRYEPKQYNVNYELPLSRLIIDDYKGDFDGFYAGAGVAGIVGGGVGGFHSPDWSIKGGFTYLSLSKGYTPFGVEVVGFHTFYTVASKVDYYYDTKTGLVDRGKLISDILTGDHSPIPLGAFAGIVGLVGNSRSGQVGTALLAASLFEKYYYQPDYSQYQCRPGQPDPQSLPPFPDPFKFPVPWDQ